VFHDAAETANSEAAQASGSADGDVAATVAHHLLNSF
jgi:hypothetical protein